MLQVYVLKRPHVDTYLERMGEMYECVLFTASLAKVNNSFIKVRQLLMKIIWRYQGNTHHLLTTLICMKVCFRNVLYFTFKLGYAVVTKNIILYVLMSIATYCTIWTIKRYTLLNIDVVYALINLLCHFGQHIHCICTCT